MRCDGGRVMITGRGGSCVRSRPLLGPAVNLFGDGPLLVRKRR